MEWLCIHLAPVGLLACALKKKIQLNTLRPRQNGRHFADDSFKCVLVIENVCISIKISLKVGPINDIPALVQIMIWPGGKLLSAPWWPSLLTHIYVTRPQWVHILRHEQNRRRFADDIFKSIFLNENHYILIQMSLKSVYKVVIYTKGCFR